MIPTIIGVTIRMATSMNNSVVLPFGRASSMILLTKRGFTNPNSVVIRMAVRTRTT